jgi:RNA polymerase-binding transcription factor DksA
MEKRHIHGVTERPTRNHSRAATADVLGARREPLRINPKWQEAYDHLTELRSYLINQRGNLAKDAQEEKVAFSEHMADAGTDSYDRDWALSMLSSEQNALYEIDQAISRIENDTYGICELTGKKIEGERLKAIPWTRFSASAAKELEKAGEMRRARLAQLGSVTDSDREITKDEDEDEENP